MAKFGNLRSLMSRQQRQGGLLLLLLMIFGAALETLGIGLVVPVLAFMTQDDPAAKYPQLAPLLAPFAGWSQTRVLMAVVLVLVLTYAFKALYLAMLAWRQSRFVFAMQLSISRRLFEGYLRQPYTFHLQRNSAQLIRNVVNETSQFSHVVTIPALILISEGLVLLAICGLLLAIEPVGAVVVTLTIGLAGLLFYRLTSSRLLRWGQSRQHHEGLRIQHLQQGLGGVKDVKLLGREALFLSRFVTHDTAVARVAERYLTLQQLPRLWLELLGVAGLAALILVMLYRGRDVSTLAPVLGVFAAAAFRLMPSVTKVLTAIQNLRYAQPVIDTLNGELSMLHETADSQPGAKLSLHRSLRMENITYRYPDAQRAALERVSLEIRPGSSVGFVGGSGAGKSTLIDVLLGLLTPGEGRVLVDDVDIHDNLRGWQNQIGYVPQNIYLTDDTLRGNVAFGVAPEQIDDAAVRRALRAAQLEEFVQQLSDGLETMVGERGVRLSGGQRQRIGIARALYHDPSILVLDEATSSLDTVTERGVMEAVSALRGAKTVLIVAHRLSTVESCDMVVRLSHGSVTQIGDPQSVLYGDAEALPADAATL